MSDKLSPTFMDASALSLENNEPLLIPAFFYKSNLQIYDFAAPIPISSKAVTWTSFSKYDCAALERQWQSIRNEAAGEDASTVVGIERLHAVDLRNWVMKPVYWAAINSSIDIATVTRGTWFYKDSNQPIPLELAINLERGYLEVRPWTTAYASELQVAHNIGLEAEEKLKHEITDEGVAKYIIYHDRLAASIGVRSLSSRLQRGLFATIGKTKRDTYIEAVRGYTFARTEVASVAGSGQKPVSHTPTAQLEDRPHFGNDVFTDETMTPPKVSDLVLVIHGIGQKLSETKESYTFTHATNKLRHLIHEQRFHPAVNSQRILRDEFCPQILPINWRIQFNPEEAGHESEKHGVFSIEDITIDAIPAVRDLLSKVVFDIPYYMSHHKQKMIESVITEANRIYALWCHNNPGFQEKGRVHIVAHSLGSAISFDVLSKQPTVAHNSVSEDTAFAFDTHHLMCIGSPAAFFLLLEQKLLIPRRNMKESTKNGDHTTQDSGHYGCLAVMNIYNFFYNTDPIAYRLNATVDADFAHSLPPTVISPNSASMLERFRLPFSSTQSTPPPSFQRVPSQVELQSHDFQRETLADDRMKLLNENGQIDYCLPNSGMMDHQYLNMIYAHSDYWNSKEFARAIVLECGRESGEANTLQGMRGIKKINISRGQPH